MKRISGFIALTILFAACNKIEQFVPVVPDSKNITSTLPDSAITLTAAKGPTVTDCDGNIYHTITIGTQVWMVENLKATKYRDCTPIPKVTDPKAWTTLTSGACISYNNNLHNIGTYGQLYNWYAVTDPRNIAPTGWHVPSRAEWNTLISYLGGTSEAGGLLKEAGLAHWVSPNTDADNSSGFKGLPGGYLGSGYFDNFFLSPFKFRDIGKRGGWWTSTAPRFLGLEYNDDDIHTGRADGTAGFSVRCILDANLQINIELTTVNPSSITQTTAISGGNITNSGLGPITVRGVCYSTSPHPTIANSTVPSGAGTGLFTATMTGLAPGTTYYVRAYATNSGGTAYGKQVSFTTQSGDATITDCDGNIYHTVTIGTQVWMVENLKTTKYRDCTPIPNVTDNTVWSTLTTGAYANYDNNIANAATYGRLYNWYAATDIRNIAPTGWHIPSESEWNTLITFLGGESVAGSAMKNTTGWLSPNTGATNSSGFTGLPGGTRGWNNGSFADVGSGGIWWTSENDGSGFAWYRYMLYNQTIVGRGISYKENGFSVRCIRD